ncbi:DUF4926 domain-containing protein [Deinococcus lacus]|uniref:DUF4926 domain-containing protein n=1 Tax=Deinococcus lacus TaxID=392561 RepID=A0ABW1YBN8_9DEIO
MKKLALFTVVRLTRETTGLRPGVTGVVVGVYSGGWYEVDVSEATAGAVMSVALHTDDFEVTSIGS